MGHIHTNNGEHDHTASAYIVRTDQQFDEPKIMLHRHKKLGVYLQFGGHIELDETPWQAITHEVLEESGYKLEDMSIYQPVERLKRLDSANMHPVAVCHNTHNFDKEGKHKHSDIGYLLCVSGEPSMQVEDGESTNFVLFSKSELEKLNSPDEIFENVKQISIYCLELVMQDRGWEEVPTSTFS